MTVSTTSPHTAFRLRAHALIPGGAHTYSKGDDLLPIAAPAAFVRGKGARVVDVADREFVDWGMGVNNVLIGHAEDAIDDAAIEALRRGQNFSRPTPLEVDVAEAVLSIFPHLDMVKFAKNGSDANTAALRLARAITGRPLVAYDSTAPFLSIHDWFIGTTAMDAGVPDAVKSLAVGFRFNDVGDLQRVFTEHGRQLAAVVLEPCREIRPSPEFLHTLRALCDRHGVILVLDEVITGFRYALAGAHAMLGIRPDLLSIGKGLANGYALTALVGRRDLMRRGGIDHDQDRVFLLSTTNGAEQASLGAALATIGFYRQHDVIAHLYAVGQAVMDGLRDAARESGVDGYVEATSDFSCRPVLSCRDRDRNPSAEGRTLFLHAMLEQGVFMPWICPSFRHGDRELSQTLDAFRHATRAYARWLEAPDQVDVGRPVKAVFRRRN